jgi:RHS repeat-associated protein
VTTRRDATNLVEDYWFDPGLKRVTRIVGPGGRVETRSYGEGLNLSAVTVSNSTAGEAVTIRLRHGPNNVVTNAAIGYRSAPVEGWTFGWDPAWLVLNRVADPEGRVVSIDYTNALPSAVRWSATPGVEDAARFQYATNGWLVSVTNANGHATRFLHDAQGYVTNIVPEVGPAVTLGYDELGHVSRLGLPGESGERTVEMTADAGGRPVWLRLPNGQEARRRYDAFGSLLSSVDAAGRTNGYGYVLGKLTNVVQNGVRVVSLAYDQQLNTVNIRDALGRPVEAYTLDAQDRPVEVTDVDGRTMRVTWGVENFVRSIQRFDGTTVSNTYDGAGRVTSVTYPGSSDTFDWYRNGLLKQAANEAGAISNAFDGANRLVRTEGVGRAGGVGYGVDPAGNVTSAVSVAGTQAYTFDAAERVTTINGVGGTFAYGYGSWNGLVAAVSNLESGLNVAYAFDVMDRVTNIVWRTGGGNLVRGFEYAYDAAGLITQKVTLAGSGTVVEKYTYDGLDRLAGETRLGSATSTVSYAFDLVGNRTAVVRDGVTESYTPGTGNRLATFGAGGAAGCDTAGCVTALVFDASRRLDLAWNGRYQLAEARTNGAVAERYGYDVLGRRAWTTDGAATNWHVYDGPHAVADLDATGGVLRAYTYGPGIDNILSMTVHTNGGGTTSVFYYVKDHLGTVHALVDAAGSVVERYEYDAWGRVLGVFDGAGNALAATALGNRYLWQGREYSWATGLYNFRARWYDPVIGRWLSNDPIGISGGLNQYVAFNNNPVNFSDPFGLTEFTRTQLEYAQKRYEAGQRNAFDSARLGISPWHTPSAKGKTLDIATPSDPGVEPVRRQFELTPKEIVFGFSAHILGQLANAVDGVFLDKPGNVWNYWGMVEVWRHQRLLDKIKRQLDKMPQESKRPICE